MTAEAWGQTGDKNSQCGQASAEEQGEGGGEGPHAERQVAKKPKSQMPPLAAMAAARRNALRAGQSQAGSPEACVPAPNRGWGRGSLLLGPGTSPQTRYFPAGH